MTVTSELITSIRQRLCEVIPSEGSEADTHFTDALITAVLQSCYSQNQALYFLWTQKAGMVQGDGGTVKQITAGGENVVMYTKMEYVAMCKDSAGLYKTAWENEGSCAMLTKRRRHADC